MPSIVIMGVAGCGKSSLGRALAEKTGLDYIEGDDYHSPLSKEKMGKGIALTDADRETWLQTLGEQLRVRSGDVVLTCSALKRAYRERLRHASPGLQFVFLDIRREEALKRVAGRGAAHFFSAALVESQFAALEPPKDEIRVLRIDAMLPVPQLRDMVAEWMDSPFL